MMKKVYPPKLEKHGTIFTTLWRAGCKHDHYYLTQIDYFFGIFSKSVYICADCGWQIEPYERME